MRLTGAFLDDDNLTGSTKALTDALVEAGVLPGDDADTLKVEVHQWRVASKGEVGTSVEIFDLPKG